MSPVYHARAAAAPSGRWHCIFGRIRLAGPGMFHAFQMADGLIPEAREAMVEIGVFLRKHLHEQI